MERKPDIHLPVRPEWLALHQEPVLEPELEIIDAHHHLWDRPGARYLLPELLEDTASGHNIIATVFMQCQAMYRAHGPEQMRVVGEVEFINGIAAMAASGLYGPTLACAAIVSHADLTLGDAVEEVLQAQIAAGNGRFRGIRHITAWDPDERFLNPRSAAPSRPGAPMVADLTTRPAVRRSRRRTPQITSCGSARTPKLASSGTTDRR